MRFASTPGAAMYGKPMVYVQFISPSDDAGCSSGAPEEQMAGPSSSPLEQLAITAGPSTGPSEQMVSHHVTDPGYLSADRKSVV